MDNTEELEREQAMLSEEKKAKSFWYADWAFPITVGIMAAAVFSLQKALLVPFPIPLCYPCISLLINELLFRKKYDSLHMFQSIFYSFQQFFN